MAKTTKIAPHLQRLLRELVKGVPLFATYHGKQATAELRAVLSVVRAAGRVERLHKRQWNGPGAIARGDMAAALARLDRLNRRKP